MSILELETVSIRYITGDFKEIGLKEYVLRRLKHNYHVTEFWADRNVTFSLEKGDMLGIIGTIQSFLEYPHKVAIGGDKK